MLFFEIVLLFDCWTKYKPLKKLFEIFPNTKEYILQLSEEEKRDMIEKEEIFDISENISTKEFQRILILQKKYRKILYIAKIHAENLNLQSYLHYPK